MSVSAAGRKTHAEPGCTDKGEALTALTKVRHCTFVRAFVHTARKCISYRSETSQKLTHQAKLYKHWHVRPTSSWLVRILGPAAAGKSRCELWNPNKMY